jgi:aspartate kinase
MDLIVSKFGGTSVGSAAAIKKLKKIITVNKKRRIIVVSAVSGITDLLISASETARKNGDWMSILNEIGKRHAKIAIDLHVKLDFSIYFNELESILSNVSSAKILTPRNRDYILSFGERLSSKIIWQYLKKEINIARINARHIIKTDSIFSNAQLDFKKTENAVKKSLLPSLKKTEKIIITGFIGSNENGEYTTLSRGGSDYTAAILASLLNAKGLEIWTDVDGILTADPRIIPKAKIVESLNYKEAAELSYFGAKILHPKTIKPVIKKKIPIRVVNTFNSEKKGTLITDFSRKGIKSISKKNGSYIINLYSTDMIESCGFLGKIFSLFEKYRAVADVVSTSEATVSVTVDSRPSKKFVSDLKKYADVEVSPKKTIICIVGEGLNEESRVLAKIFASISQYPVRIVSQNSSARNITLVVDKEDDKKIIRLIYKKLFEK